MKRNALLSVILFAASPMFPAIVIVFSLAGYSLRIGSGFVLPAAATAVYFAVGILLLVHKDRRIRKTHAALLCVSLILNQINTFWYIAYAENNWTILFFASWLLMTAAVVAVYVRSIGLKAVFYTLSGCLFYPMFLFFLFGGMVSNTVVAREISPDGAYCAEVIDNNQGALGGATVLTIYREDQSFTICSWEFRKGEKTVYYGRWGEYRRLYWTDASHIMLNGTTYAMEDLYP